ncbi:MAG: NUDIX hydrolase [Emcibacter sp.]|nr:NUDIX hydrolase [Emcibacter sp.]
MTDKPVKAKDSASVLIIRDADEHERYGSLQILMVKRHRNIKFAGGAYVFPGGKLDAGDRSVEESLTRNVDVGESFYGLRYTALREVFEETGLVIGALDGKPIGEELRRTIDETYRADFLSGTIELAEFLDRSTVTFDMSDCFPFAHWITPEAYPIRFDTRFFLCVAPEGQVPSPDGHEITEVDWMYPMQLVDESDGDLMFPTMMNLKKLGQAKTVSEALVLLAERKIVMVMPELVVGDKGNIRKIPDDAGYEDVDQTRTRSAIELDKA